MIGSLQASALRRAFVSGELTAEAVVEEVLDRISARGDDAVWIHLVDREELLAAARGLAARFPGTDLPPLYGLPFAVKDNIDVSGLPTTAACPEFAYTASETAPVVQRALDAGAILVGKTNLDQFATGLSGTRSPYGIVRNPFDPAVISGGSSSGSAVAVATGLVTFALGTDTAGSGRVPAGLTGTVGVKPSRGLVSARGIVPACKSLDCPSIFALSVADGAEVLAVVAGRDPEDPYSRELPEPTGVSPRADLVGVRIGVPAALDLDVDFSGDVVAAAAFDRAVARVVTLGARVVPVDLGPFLAAGRLLYDGPWIAERSAGLDTFLAGHPGALHPVTREVLSRAGLVGGSEVFRGLHELADLQRRTACVWDGIDTMLVPTAPTAPTIEEMLADPIAVNSALGRFTNFVNLLDLAAVAVPSEVTPTGVPVGVTLLAPTGFDGLLLSIAATWEGDVDLPVTTAGHALVRPPGADGHGVIARDDQGAGEEVRVAVVGAHLEGEPLHGDLLRLGAHLSARVRTSDHYRLYALPTGGGGPARPGLVRVHTGGRSVATEVYWLPVESLGRLVASIPAPLGIGTVKLADGTSALGFVCEHAGALEARDITMHGGWREYLAAMAAG